MTTHPTSQQAQLPSSPDPAPPTAWGVLAEGAQLLALGECTHLDSALVRRRNALLPDLIALGFRSIALETDRVAALGVDDYVSGRADDLDEAMAGGFSHGFGRMSANRELVQLLRRHNESHDEDERVTFHGIDAPVENMSAPSPLPYLQQAARYLGRDVSPVDGDPGGLDLASVAGPDERWSRTEAVLDATASPGGSVAAAQLGRWAEDATDELMARVPELVRTTSLPEWHRCRIVLAAGRGLLRYHRACARAAEPAVRISRLLALRDVLMADNILDIRRLEAGRGPTFVFAHNAHLQRVPTSMEMGGMELEWTPAGAIVAELLAERLVFVAGSLGRSEGLGLAAPAPGTYEHALDGLADPWALVPVSAVPAGVRRSDVRPEQGCAPLDPLLLGVADAVLHIREGTADRSWI